jgi:hypothetical protein
MLRIWAAMRTSLVGVSAEHKIYPTMRPATSFGCRYALVLSLQL